MNIQVFGQEELLRKLNSGYSVCSHCISISNVDEISPDLNTYFKDVLYLKFNDTTDSNNKPKKNDIEKVINFYNSTKNDADGYTIHCQFGISRSASIALCILYLIYNSEEVAWKKLAEIRYQANVRQDICALFDEIQGSDLSNTRNYFIQERKIQIINKIKNKIK